MKNFYLTLVLLALLNYNCSNDNTVAAAQAEPVTETPGTTATAEDPVKKLKEEKQKRTEALKQLTPYSPDDLKKLLPAEWSGMKQRNLEGHSALGFAQASCTYKKDSVLVEMNVYDCAGEIGASQYALNFWSKLGVPEENENGYTRSIEMNGITAVESFDKASNKASLRFMAENRLLVMLTAKNVSTDQLKDHAARISFK